MPFSNELPIIFLIDLFCCKNQPLFYNLLQLLFAGIRLECHPAVPLDDVLWLQETIVNEGIPFEEAIRLLRKKMFPEDYEPCTWIEGACRNKKK